MQSKHLFSIRSPQPSFWHRFRSRRQEPQPRGDGDPGRKAGNDRQREQDVTKTPERASIETHIRLLNLVSTKTDMFFLSLGLFVSPGAQTRRLTS